MAQNGQWVGFKLLGWAGAASGLAADGAHNKNDYINWHSTPLLLPPVKASQDHRPAAGTE